MELALNRRSADGSCYERRSVVRTAVAIAGAGALGALARYGVEGAITRRVAAFPWGTFVVNVSGSFALGFVVTLLGERLAVASWLRAALAIGFLGAYTTFSTLSLESYRLLESRSYGLAGANLLGSVVAGLVALYGGVVLGRAL
jgi:CrcB protein